MSKNQELIEKLFLPHLQAEEEIIWLGEQSNPIKTLYVNFPIQLLSFIARLINVLWLAILCISVVILLTAILLGIIAGWIVGFWGIFKTTVQPEYLIPSILIIAVLIFLTPYFYKEITQKNMLNHLGNRLKEARQNMYFVDFTNFKLRLKTHNSIYFTITNQRILSLEMSKLHQYSLILLQDAILSKPQNGAVDILLYDQTSPTGKMPKPIGILEGIAEESAQEAYELLRQAREEALDTRAQKMGID